MTSYFKVCKTQEEAKKIYKKLALENHPDKGGDVDIMKEINAQFEVAFRIFPSISDEKMDTFKREFYTQNGWEGNRYQRGLSNKDIAKRVRMYVKSKYNDCRFSITSDSYCVSVSLKESPMEVLANKKVVEEYVEMQNRRYNGFGNTFENFTNHVLEGGHDFVYGHEERLFMNKEALDILTDIREFVMSYNYDDSDSQIDYFNTNFYSHLKVGKWDKSWKKVARVRKSNKLCVA